MKQLRVPAGTMEDVTIAHAASAMPALLGPYRILGVLGSGGMGIVYRGQHIETAQLAAVKTLRDAAKGLIASIRREIHALERVRHPGIVAIVGQGVTDGVPWYAMELLVGRTLRDYMAPPSSTVEARSGATSEPAAHETKTGAVVDFPDPLAPPSSVTRTSRRSREREELLALLQRVCAPLAHSHACGVVHRDLKPENIFVQNDGTPVLVDFGIASRFGGAGGREELDAATGTIGTLGYMAPEQLRGELVDARADLYALGCILYECLTGEPPPTRPAWPDSRHASRTLPPSELADDISPALDQLTRRLLEERPEDRVGYADDVAQALKEILEPQSAAPPQSEKSYLYRPPFVGRGPGLTELRSAIRQVRVNGRGQLLLVGGESGVGKTRLALEAVRDALEEDMTVVLSGCGSLSATAGNEVSAGDTPLHPFAPLLLTLADHCRELGASETVRILGADGKALAPYQSALAEVPGFAELPALPALEPTQARARVFTALAKALFAFAEVRPVALVIDDLQWADELSLSFLSSLSKEGLSTVALLVVGTYRSDDLSPALSTVLAAPEAMSLTVERLDVAEVSHMVGGMLALRESPAELVDYVYRKSEGNPFFVVECLRAAISENLLARNAGGRWAMCATDGPSSAEISLPLPATLAQLLERRLRGLGQDAVSLLAMASVLGRQFDGELLFSCADLDADSAMDAVHVLRQRQVLEETANGALRFAHDQLRAATYRSVETAELKLLHRRAAQAFEARRPVQGSSLPLHAALAHHWSHAGEAALACDHFRLAGQSARAVYAFEDAAGYYQAAILEAERAGEMRDGWLGLHEDLGDVSSSLGRQEAAREAYLQAAAKTNAPLSRARLFRKTGKTHETRHEHETALRFYSDAEDALGPPLPRSQSAPTEAREEAWWSEWIQVQINRVMVHYWLAREQEIEPLIDKLRSLAQIHGAGQARAQLFKSLAYMNMRRERFALSRQTVNYARGRLEASIEWGDEGEIVEARLMVALALLWHGDFAAAEQLFLEVIPIAENRGDATMLSRFIAYLLFAQRRRGDAEAVAATAARCRAVALAAGMAEYLGIAEANLGWLAWRRGSFATARAHCQRALEIWSGLSLVYPFEWMARLVLVDIELREGSFAPAREHASKMLDQKQQLLPPPVELAIRECMQDGALPAKPAAFHALIETAREHAFC